VPGKRGLGAPASVHAGRARPTAPGGGRVAAAATTETGPEPQRPPPLSALCRSGPPATCGSPARCRRTAATRRSEPRLGGAGLPGIGGAAAGSSPREALWAALTPRGPSRRGRALFPLARLPACSSPRRSCAASRPEIEAGLTPRDPGAEPGGIGSATRKALALSDQVAYLCGLDLGFWAAVPRLAVLVLVAARSGRPAARGVDPDRLLTAPATPCSPLPRLSAGYRRTSTTRAARRTTAGPSPSSFISILPAGSAREARSPSGRRAVAFRPRRGSCCRREAARPIFFDVRTVPTRCCRGEPGPPRWSLVLWLQDGAPPRPRAAAFHPGADADRRAPGRSDPPLPPGVLLATSWPATRRAADRTWR